MARTPAQMNSWITRHVNLNTILTTIVIALLGYFAQTGINFTKKLIEVDELHSKQIEHINFRLYIDSLELKRLWETREKDYYENYDKRKNKH